MQRFQSGDHLQDRSAGTGASVAAEGSPRRRDGHPLASLPGFAALTLVGRVLGQEIRGALYRWLFRLAVMTGVLITVSLVMVAGVLRLADVLALTCGRWMGDPLIGESLVGLGMVVVPLVAIAVVWRRLQR